MPETATTHECAGALILQQREFMEFSEISKNPATENALREYRKRRPLGMTADGLRALAGRAIFSWPGEVEMSRPELSDEDVGYTAIDHKEEAE